MTRPDLDAILARIGVVHREHPPCASEDVTTLLAYIDDLEERCRAYEQMSYEIARSLDTWKQEEVPDED